MWQRHINRFLTLIFCPPAAASVLLFALRTVEILTPTQAIFPASGLAGVSLCQGMSVMSNAYPPVRNQNQSATSLSIRDDEDADMDGDLDNEMLSLLEENARLRALVVRLSGIVLRNVVNEK